MCGIAGILEAGRRPIAPESLSAMAAAIEHRGPDEEGFFLNEHVGLACRRLSIVDVAGGHQPVFNEDQSIVAVFNGELYDHQAQRERLKARGYVFRSRCDSEIIVHLWEEYGEALFEHLHGQFAFALFDRNQNLLILARDRLGIRPLHWARRGDRLFFASEIKAILAAGEVAAEPDLKGIDSILSMFAMPARRTPFKGIQAVQPAGYLRVRFGPDTGEIDVSEHAYWDLNFPDRGEEHPPASSVALIDEYERLFRDSVARRLRADVPVAACLSGGVDSAMVVQTASQIQDNPVHAFSIKIDSPFFDETEATRFNARAIGCPLTIVTCTPRQLQDSYHQLIRAAENPVVDTSCAAIYALAAAVRAHGYKVVLSGEGADEALGSYPWFKFHKLLSLANVGAFQPGRIPRWMLWKLLASALPAADRRRIQDLLGCTAQSGFYGLLASARWRMFHPDVLASLKGYSPFQELELDRERMRRWHPLNQSIYVGYKTHLSGMLLSHKSDRVAMAHSVESRFPFLDERLIEFCCRLPPSWKLRGITRDKFVQRRVAERMLPRPVARRRKKMFRAPLGGMLKTAENGIAGQLLSPESLRRTGYFSVEGVQTALRQSQSRRRRPGQSFTELGLVAVFATQLWHHIFLGGGLCELPQFRADRFPVQPPHSLPVFQPGAETA